MEVVSWRPVITRVDSRPGSENPHYHVAVDLRCLFCGETITAKTNRHELNARQNSKLATHTVETITLLTVNAIGPLKSPRSCDVCGIVSSIPLRQFEQLLEQVQRLITVEWVRKQCNAKPLKPARDILNHQIIEPRL